ncbi:hypothetical protein O181_007319 [Austropuccinia psidii MF-1]|uniref:Uncharacterized protein n=1 Tax=Austropuccinia psidii MF-1 TaxID=1389203 RepID=A0A9Q3GHS0_9BASI|nr:hypothetical protein [Austropuccinia psidii MF-1]
MEKSSGLSLYIADFRSLMSIIGDLEERAYIHVYRRGFASMLLDRWASHPGNFDSLHDLMDITFDLDISNGFPIDFNSVSLVGELQKPSLPSSFHIPPIIPSHSLLPSRDEVFNDIEAIQEDVARSSLHLFQGDMDLPP